MLILKNYNMRKVTDEKSDKAHNTANNILCPIFHNRKFVIDGIRALIQVSTSSRGLFKEDQILEIANS
jgi:hypothetical protein